MENEQQILFLKAIIGNKITRQRIYIDTCLLDELTEIKQKYDSSLSICEMVECCFDYFNLDDPYQKEHAQNSCIYQKFKETKKVSQLYIREDIVTILKQIKNQTGVSIREIISEIIKIQMSYI